MVVSEQAPAGVDELFATLAPISRRPRATIRETYDYRPSHDGQQRLFREPYIIHPMPSPSSSPS